MIVPLDQFVETTGLCPSQYRFLHDIVGISCLRDIREVNDLVPMPSMYLFTLLDNVTYGQPKLLGHAYRGCWYDLASLEIESLHISQRFVQKDKLEFFANGFARHFLGDQPTWCSSAVIVRGCDVDGNRVIGQYLPPVIEQHGSELRLLEGMTRCQLAHQQQLTQRAILVRDVQAPFPWVTVPWCDVAVVEEKPPPDQRKFGGDPTYFRHFLPVGVDT